LVATSVFAREKSDVIVMRNGDRITCEIKGLDADTLYISVDYILSTLSVNWSKVDHVESKQLFIVKTQEGLVYSGTLSTSETARRTALWIQILEANNNVELDKAQIIKMDETSHNFLQRFNGEVGMGIIYSKGNQSTQYKCYKGCPSCQVALVPHEEVRWRFQSVHCTGHTFPGSETDNAATK